MREQQFPSDVQILQAKLALREAEWDRLCEQQQQCENKLRDLRVRLVDLQSYVHSVKTAIQYELRLQAESEKDRGSETDSPITTTDRFIKTYDAEPPPTGRAVAPDGGSSS